MEFNYLGEKFKASTNVVSDFDTTGMRLIRDKETISDDLTMFDMSKQGNVTIRDMLHATMLKKGCNIQSRCIRSHYTQYCSGCILL